jgi:hypothetical protein
VTFSPKVKSSLFQALIRERTELIVVPIYINPLVIVEKTSVPDII